MKMKWIVIGVVILMLGGGGYYYYAQGHSRHGKSGTNVQTIEAKLGSIQETVDATGEVLPLNRVEIKPPIGGRIEQLLVDEGTHVKAGQILAWMSSTDRASILDAARAKGPEEEKKWQDAYKPTPIIAPLSGVIILRNVVVGQTVDSTIVIYAMSDKLIVKADVDETDVGRIRLGMDAIITLDSYPDKPITGSVFQILYEGVNTSNVITYGVKIEPKNVPPFFRSQMTANISLVANKKENVVLLPESAIQPSPTGDRQVMMRGPDGKPVAHVVQVGLENGDQAEITSGVQEGDQVLVIRKRYTPQQAASNSPLVAGGPTTGRNGGGGGGNGNSKMSLIELKGIGRSYWVGGGELKVLKDVSLSIEAGEFVAIIGPSGSGKSTLMQILGLLDRPTYGTYTLMGQDVSRLTDDEGAALRSKTIGFIFQMFNLLSRTSALDNVGLPMIYSGATNREERSREVLKAVGLSDRMDHKPNQLSGGQQQRVAIARSLVNRPKILFADEPTGNLASDQAEDILRQLQALNDTGITVIMVTHDPDIAAHARRILHIKDGRIISDERKKSDPSVRTNETSEKTSFGALEHPSFSFTEMKEYAASALRAISANKVRSGLSMLGILIGVAAVIAMLAIGKGAQKAIEARLSSLGSNLLMLIPSRSSIGGVFGGAGSVSRLTMEDIKAIQRSSPYIAGVDGNVSGSVQVTYGDKNANTTVTGALPIYQTMRNSAPYYGRFYTDSENIAQARVCLLGQTVINNLFGKQNPIDKTIKIDHIGFLVIGVLPIKGATGFRDQDDMILVPLNTAMNRVLGKKYFNNIYIECATPESIPDVMQDLSILMRKRHRLPAWKDDDFDIRNMADIQAALQGTTQTFTLLLGIVAAISLLVGGIGIMNIMLVSVTERTREIGLRKAVGAARRAILMQFLLESAVLSTLGGLIGIVLGMTISFIMSHFAGWGAEVTLQSVLLAFFFSASTGIIFGFWPARKASLLSPIEALRYE